MPKLEKLVGEALPLTLQVDQSLDLHLSEGFELTVLRGGQRAEYLTNAINAKFCGKRIDKALLEEMLAYAIELEEGRKTYGNTS